MAGPTAPLQAARSADNRDAILDSAEHLMATLGFEATTIAQICAASGFPVGSIYHHFGNKAGVLAAIMTRGNERFFAGMPDPSSLRGSPEERMRAYWHAATAGIVANSDYFRLNVDVLRTSQTEDAALGSIVERLNAAPIQHLTEVVEPFAQAAGVGDVAQVSARVVELTITFTLGAVVRSGNDLQLLQQMLDELYAILRGYIIHQGLLDATQH